MASNIKTLKEDNGDIVYPQTLTGAVYTSNNTALDTELAKYVTAEDIATTATSFGTITTGMISDGAVTSAKLDSSVLAFGSYSTSEVDTGFTWIDGSHIYKKTIDCGDLVNTTYKSIAHGISNLACVISFTGMMQDKAASNRRWRPLNIPNTNVQNYIIVEIDATYVWVYCGADRTNQTAWVTLYYTKSS